MSLDVGVSVEPDEQAITRHEVVTSSARTGFQNKFIAPMARPVAGSSAGTLRPFVPGATQFQPAGVLAPLHVCSESSCVPVS